jgi:hypothetical protein
MPVKVSQAFHTKVFLEEDKIQGLLFFGGGGAGDRGGEQERIPEVLWRKKGKVQGLLPQGERGRRS